MARLPFFDKKYSTKSENDYSRFVAMRFIKFLLCLNGISSVWNSLLSQLVTTL